MNKENIPVESFMTALLQIDRLKAAAIFENCYQSQGEYEAVELMTMKALEKIGADWENGLLSLSQVYMSGVICEELIDKYLSSVKITNKTNPKMAIAVLQDHHALGKRIISSVLSAGGYELLDMGYGLSPEEIVEQTLAEKIDVLLISVLMLPSALKVKEVVHLLREKGSKTNVIVGGAPFRMDESLWRTVDADATSPNGTDVIRIVERLTKGGQPE